MIEVDGHSEKLGHPMNPPIDRSMAVPFHQLPESSFQYLCRDLLREQPGATNSIAYGSRGQAQFGVDILVTMDSNECWGADAKAYEKFGKADLEKALGKFQENLKHWKKQGLVHFIVMVGSRVEDRKVHDHLAEEKKKFSSNGIRIDLWDSDEIARALRPHRHIVGKYISNAADHWTEKICGRDVRAIKLGRGLIHGRSSSVGLVGVSLGVI